MRNLKNKILFGWQPVFLYTSNVNNHLEVLPCPSSRRAYKQNWQKNLNQDQKFKILNSALTWLYSAAQPAPLSLSVRTGSAWWCSPGAPAIDAPASMSGPSPSTRAYKQNWLKKNIYFKFSLFFNYYFLISVSTNRHFFIFISQVQFFYKMPRSEFFFKYDYDLQ